MHDLWNQLITTLQWMDAANRAQDSFPRFWIAFPALTLLLFVTLTPIGFSTRFWRGNLGVSIGIAILCLWHWDPIVAASSLIPFVFAAIFYMHAFFYGSQRSNGAVTDVIAAGMVAMPEARRRGWFRR